MSKCLRIHLIISHHLIHIFTGTASIFTYKIPVLRGLLLSYIPPILSACVVGPAGSMLRPLRGRGWALAALRAGGPSLAGAAAYFSRDF